MAQHYEVLKHEKIKGAIVRIIKRTPTREHSHLVLVEAVEPHKHIPKGERVELDVRDLLLQRHRLKWQKPFELNGLRQRNREE